ncbi:MAG TPA: LacI family DNA-binding transcriptional regulator [Anaerolineaceae bacterium]|nr:LacI family DNA-binding transcriptional regulator [Anaerolineaceae bacterium]
MASINDVAKRAGVSITTVSRVLNNSAHPVNSETRERVQEAIKELNFMPNQLARALANEKTHLIGVIVGDGSDPYFANIVRGISDTAQENGYLTIICNTERIPQVELSFLGLLRDYNADAIVFAGGGIIDPRYQDDLREIVADLQAREVPIIALSSQYLDVPQVKIDDISAAKEMTDYLVGLGHRRIGFITGPMNLITSLLRLEGYKQGLAQAGIEYDPELVYEGEFSYESGKQASIVLMGRDNPPTAIFGSDDQDALGCLFQLRTSGYHIPEQVSVAGFDDIEFTQYVYPALTTVHVPMQHIGEIGVRQVLKALGQTDPLEPIHTIPHRLVIRASTARPPRE